MTTENQRPVSSRATKKLNVSSSSSGPSTRRRWARKGPPLADGETPSGAGALRRALAYLRSYKRESGGAIVSLLLVSAANLATPILIGRAIDDGVGQRRLDVIFLIVGALVGLALVRGLFTFLQGYLAERASQGVAYDLRDALFERIERLSFSYYDRVQTGQLVTRLTSDVEQIRSFAGLRRRPARQRRRDARRHDGLAPLPRLATRPRRAGRRARHRALAGAVHQQHPSSFQGGPADARATEHRFAGGPCGGTRDPGLRPRGLRDGPLHVGERRSFWTRTSPPCGYSRTTSPSCSCSPTSGRWRSSGSAAGR